MNKFYKPLLILLILMFLAIIHLTFQTQNIALKYETSEIKMRIKGLRDNNRNIQALIARATNLTEVERQAKEKLGMEYPENIRYIVATGEVK